MTDTQTEAMVEELARAICRIVGAMGDPDAVEQQRVNLEWRSYTRYARAALTSPTITRLLADNARLTAEREEALAKRDAEIADWLESKGMGMDEVAQDNGWWETSTGAEFGQSILQAIRSGEYRKDDHG